MSISDYVVIGYDTKDHNLPLFKVGTVPNRNGYVRTAKEVQDDIAEDQAQTRPHIIYTVVRKSDLWW